MCPIATHHVSVRGTSSPAVGTIPGAGEHTLAVSPPLPVAQGDLIGLAITPTEPGLFYLVVGESSHMTRIFDPFLSNGETRAPNRQLDGDLPVRFWLDPSG